mmetsp:Transcript_39530/g.97895  ORF Transcript_39530/g.97895 Transcript_39530/m.97895 type:complete len:522 (+) Transcript_39530:262-1827(+)
MLMDIFHSTLPQNLARVARRTHFHAFMAEVHQRLHATRRGHADPLAAVAAAIHAESPVLCFDEMEIVDVADALVLKRIFERIFALGGVLVATSNAAPEELYEGGINRAAFLPFIGTLRERCAVVSLDDIITDRYHDGAQQEASVSASAASVALAAVDGSVRASRRVAAGGAGEYREGIDYRQLTGRGRGREVKQVTSSAGGGAHANITRAGTASSGDLDPRYPSVMCGEPSVMLAIINGDTAAADAALGRVWGEACKVMAGAGKNGCAGADEDEVDVRVPVASGRSLIVPRLLGRCAWFHFDNLCGPRGHLGAADYITLADRFDAIAIAGVPVFSTHNENEARRFINLVDVLYERRTLLIASLAAPLATLFRGEEEEEKEQVLLSSPLLFLPLALRGGDVVAESAADGDVSTNYVRNAVKRRVRLEGSWGGGVATVSGEGGSSGRSTTMVGSMEWSATGRAGASLADLQRVNFTFRASRRCASRLVEMGGAAYEAAWANRHSYNGQRGGGGAVVLKVEIEE